MTTAIENKPTIAERLLQVRRTVCYLQKENQGYQYKYVSSGQVLGSLHDAINNAGLVLVPQIKNKTIEREKSGNGKFVITLEMEYCWIDCASGESLVVLWIATGADGDPSRALGKALTYGEKYFFLKFFNIPTDNDDPDSFQEKKEKQQQKQEQKQQEQKVKEQQQKQQEESEQHKARREELFAALKLEMERTAADSAYVIDLAKSNGIMVKSAGAAKHEELEKILELLSCLPSSDEQEVTETQQQQEEKQQEATVCDIPIPRISEMIPDPDTDSYFDKKYIPECYLPLTMRKEPLTGKDLATDRNTAWTSAAGKQFFCYRQLLKIWSGQKTNGSRIGMDKKKYATVLLERYPSENENK